MKRLMMNKMFLELVCTGILVLGNIPGGNAFGAAGYDDDGVRRIYPTTGKQVEIEYSKRHKNGDRYNGNHKYVNYEVTGYFLTSEAEKLELKTDGPNHGDCEELPRCVWLEPSFEMDGGRAYLNAEYPHPESHDFLPCPSCQTIGGKLNNKWVGYKVIAYYDADGLRTIEQWVDPDGLDSTGKPANNWILTLKETDKGQLTPYPKRKLPLEGDGLEAEIRVHHGHDTEMKFGKISEIVQPNQ
ncbi:MAG: hypothetical protein AB7T49_10425 [Oligoflexales bacterium]